jgi:acyl carrier protein
MSTDTEAVTELAELPRSERLEALELLVVEEFKATLLMPDDEELPLDESYFTLGFTSLRIAEVKQRLETRLGCRISATVLFNSPTVERLLDYLTEDALTGLFA